MFHSVSPTFGGFYRCIAGKSENKIDDNVFFDTAIDSLSIPWEEQKEFEQDQFKSIREVLPNATKVKLVMDPDEGDMYIAADDDNGEHATPYLNLESEYIGSHPGSDFGIAGQQTLDEKPMLLLLKSLESYNAATQKLFKKDLEAGTHGTVTIIGDSATFKPKEALEN